jgi:hypothetical protein
MIASCCWRAFIPGVPENLSIPTLTGEGVFGGLGQDYGMLVFYQMVWHYIFWPDCCSHKQPRLYSGIKRAAN